MLTIVDVFAGCGGMTRGFVDVRDPSGRAVFEPVLAVEWDSHAAATYRANFGLHVANTPIEDVARFPKADVLIGGPPCQGFSALNRNGVGFERRALWREYLRALKAIDPSWFVMENVPQLLTSPEFAAFTRSVASRYMVSAAVLNAADFGVPQTRRRAIVVGSRVGLAPLPTPTRGEGSASGAPWSTVRQALEGLPVRPDGGRWHRSRNPTDVSLRRYAAVPHDGGNRFQMQAKLDAAGLGDLVPRCWRQKTTGTTDVFGRMWWDRPAPTIRTEFYKPEKGRYLHPEADRPITVREAARLMDFPDDFELPENQALTHIGRQVGNAVPVGLARAIADVIAADAGHAAGGATSAALQACAA